LYREDPNYVPQLNFQQRAFLGLKNPFFEHSQVAYFLAYDDGRVSGRIAAIWNSNHLQAYDDQTGFFGFFEVENNPATARALFDRAVAWLREKNVKRIVGPENFTTNDSCGLLVDGFNEPATFLMPYNKPYYQSLLLDYGFQPLMELYCYRSPIEAWEKAFHRKFEVIEKRLHAAGIFIRPIDFKNFESEIKQLKLLYNACNEGNWGFLPLTENEFAYMAKELKEVVEQDSILIAEKHGKPIGYMVAVPDLNQVLGHAKNGRLLWTGWIHLLNWKKKVKKIRVMIMGVLPEYRNRGIDGGFYVRLFHYMKKRNMIYAEPSYVMKENTRMLRLLKHLESEKVKTYHLLELHV
jgi:GNAT superfamily N-acetyltransferase